MKTFRLILNDEQLTHYFEVGNERFVYKMSKYFPKVISVTLENWVDENNNTITLKVVTGENDPITTIEQYMSYNSDVKLCQTLNSVIQWTSDRSLCNQIRQLNMDPSMLTSGLDTFQLLAKSYNEIELSYAKGA